MFKIETGIALPRKQSNEFTEALRNLNVGESFAAPFTYNSAHSRAHGFGKTVIGNGRKFIVRKEGAGVRIWRTE